MKKGDGFARLNAALKALNGVEGKVGYFEEARYPDGMAVAQRAAIHEIGFAPGGIPPRPTLGPAIGANAEGYRDLFAKGARSILAGKSDPVDVMEKVMLRAASDVGTAINTLTSPPLKPETVKRKGFDKPLIETALMSQSVTGVAERVK